MIFGGCGCFLSVGGGVGGCEFRLGGLKGVEFCVSFVLIVIEVWMY